MTLESQLRPVKRDAIALALELATAVVGGYQNKGLMDRSIRERYGPQTLKLVVFQEQVVEWFETRCRRSGIRGITFVACTSGKPGRKQVNQGHSREVDSAHI